MQHQLFILWDHSYIWGLMAWRAATAMGLPHRLVKAQEIAQGALSCKPALLLVPGGTARLKYQALGERGREAIVRYVAQGGAYLGFCGGAGLGLSGTGGLNLCPWERASYTNRLQHLVSGHMQARTHPYAICQPQSTAKHIALPVWWPGRFAPTSTNVHILATYAQPDADLWLADIPLASLPQNILEQWQNIYGITMGTDDMLHQPCVIAGEYEKGRYVLSYSHLETPHSSEANTWLAHLMQNIAHLQPACAVLPPWDVSALPVVWSHNALTAPLFAAQQGIAKLIALGAEHNLLFQRTSWLCGWRTGIPGAALNNLHTALSTALSLPMNNAAHAYWQEQSDTVRRALEIFLPGVEGYLLAERLATTLAASLPDMVDKRSLKAQRETLFGQPMEGGGLYQILLNIIDELVFLLATPYPSQ